jgi:myo-inositol-hexaphosphate 3-phosphohydrolase
MVVPMGTAAVAIDPVVIVSNVKPSQPKIIVAVIKSGLIVIDVLNRVILGL